MFFNKENDGKVVPGARRRTVPLLPLRDIIVFPHMVSQLFVGRERSINALDAAMAAVIVGAVRMSSPFIDRQCGRRSRSRHSRS